MESSKVIENREIRKLKTGDYDPYIIQISRQKKLKNKIIKEGKKYIVYNYSEENKNIIQNIKLIVIEIVNKIWKGNLLNRIKKELRMVEFEFSNIGTVYLIEAIIIVYTTKEYNLSKYIYPEISKRHQKSVLNIKWNIEKSIKSMNRYTDKATISLYFNVPKGTNITPKRVISTIIEKLQSIDIDENGNIVGIF